VSTDLLAGLLAGLTVALPIGAIGSYLVGLAARQRFAVAAAAALGVATADGLYALVAGLGIGGVERIVGATAGPMRWLAAALLVGLATRTTVLALRKAGPRPGRSQPGESVRGEARWQRSDRPVERVRPGSPLRTYALLVGLTAVNPATIATFAAIVVGHRLGGSPLWLAALIFGLGAFTASAGWQLTLVTAGAMLGRILSGRRGQLAVSSISAGVMLVLAVVTVLG
jgi:arginine exporter protein ArgO